MSFNIKKVLLAGTAIVAVGSLAPAAQAADITLTGNAVWGTAANGMVATPTAGDNVIMSTFNLGLDTTETGVTTVGAITATTGDLTIDTTGDAGNVSFTIGSFTGSSTADITVDNLNASTNRNVAANFTGAVSTGGALIVRNTEVGANNTTVTMTVGGNTTIGGTTAIQTTGTGRTGVTATLDLNGSTNVFTGAVTVTGGAADASNDSTLSISGASTTFTGGLTLTNGAVGQAVFNVDGTVAQTIAGAIAGDGEINVTNTNSSGVTFSGNLTHTGALLVSNNGNNQSVTFSGNLASALTLGNNAGTDTVTATFSGGAQAISGAIAGGGADTSNLVFSGGNTKTLTGAVSAIDNTTVQGSTTVTTNQNFASTNITVASGSTFATTANTVTATTIANAGTLAMNGGSVTSALTGAGTLDVNNSGTFTGNITQGTVTIAESADLAFTAAGGARTLTANIVLEDATSNGTDATLALTPAGNGIDITGNVTTQINGEGEITIADGTGAVDFVGNIGTSALRVGALTVAGGAANVTTFTGNVYVDAITMDDADELRFIGTSPQIVSGTLDDGILTIGNGTAASNVTFNGVLGGSTLGAMTVAANSTATFNANVTGAAFTNTGTTRVGSGAVLTASSFTDTGSYVLNLVDANGTLAASDFGQMTDSGGASTIANSRFSVNVTGDVGTGTAASVLEVIDLTSPGAISDNSLQYSFTTVDNGANVDITVSRVTTQSLATSPNTGVATTLEGLRTVSLAGTANTQLGQIIDNLSAASTQEAFNEILEAAGPTVDGGAVVGGFNASVQSIDVSNTRLAALRNGEETGMVAGEMASGLTGWVQGFGQMADQDRRDGVDGYEADTYGLAVGMDSADVLDYATLGVSLSYAQTDVESKNATSTDSEVDSYQVSVYGDYDVAPQTYISGTLAFAWNDIDQTRTNVGGVSGLTARADYDSNQYIAYVEAGREFEVANKTSLTPHVLAHYQHISIDDYTETGAGGANLIVDSEDLDIFELGVGAELAWDLMDNSGAKVRPALNVGYRHDLVGDDVSSTSTFTGGGASFETNGLEPANGTFNVGAGISYAMDNNWTFTADYDYEIKSDYDAHSGFVRAGYKF